MRLELTSVKKTISRNLDIDVSDLNGEKVMMNLDKGQYYALNEVGSRIWELMNEPMTVEGIVNALLQEYDVSYDSCMVNVMDFLGRLKDDELICIY